MGDLSLDLRPSFVPKTINDFVKELPLISNVNERFLKVDDFVRKLEDEFNKIDAFKRELPLCMVLLQDAIRVMREELVQCTALLNTRPKLEELVLLKKESDEDGDNDKKESECCADKKSWIASLQLGGSVTSDPICDLKQNAKLESKRDEGCKRLDSDDLFRTARDRSAGRGFVPFKAFSGFPSMRKEEKVELPVHGLSLLTPGSKSREESSFVASKSGSNRGVTSIDQTLPSNLRAGLQQPQQQPVRKQRRCWSPELHRRFVNALHRLGGAQVATPKQIRELMQVEGLTNDEVKSHLQKYRLHTRRLPSATATPANQSIVVLGGVRMSQDQFGDSSKASISQSGSPQGPLQLAGNSGGTSITGDSMEDDEDEKSDSYSWKSHTYKPGKDDI